MPELQRYQAFIRDLKRNPAMRIASEQHLRQAIKDGEIQMATGDKVLAPNDLDFDTFRVDWPDVITEDGGVRIFITSNTGEEAVPTTPGFLWTT